MSPAPSAHGGNVAALARRLGVAPESILDFSSNTDSLAADLTARIVRETGVPFDRYPDPESLALRRAVARHEGVDADHVLAGNGSSELIHAALAALRPARVGIVAPVFSEYAVACERLGIPYTLHLLDAADSFALTPGKMARIATAGDEVLVLCTPNNPSTATYADIAPLLDAPGRTVLVDNTYREFLYPSPRHAEHFFTAYAAAAAPGTRVISLCSFTKYFFCTGIRLGYLVAAPDTVAAIHAARAPWSVWEYAERLGIRFLERIEEYRAAKRELPALKRAFAAMLEESGAFDRVLVSDANFCTCECAPGVDAPALCEALAQRAILVRLLDNVPGMPPGWIRMQVKNSQENGGLKDALAAVLA